MKAQKVKLEPDAPLDESLLAILSVRLDELYSFDAGDRGTCTTCASLPSASATSSRQPSRCFGEPAAHGVKTMKQLQDLLGDIHDCDELLPLVDRHVEKLRAEDVVAATQAAPLPNRRKYRGLEALRAHTIADRERLHSRFARKWAKLERDAFRVKLEVELARSGVPA